MSLLSLTVEIVFLMLAFEISAPNERFAPENLTNGISQYKKYGRRSYIESGRKERDTKGVLYVNNGQNMSRCQCTWLYLNSYRSDCDKFEYDAGMKWARWFAFGTNSKLEEDWTYNEYEAYGDGTRERRSNREPGARGRRDRGSKSPDHRSKRESYKFLLENIMCEFVSDHSYPVNSKDKLQVVCQFRAEWDYFLSIRDSKPTSQWSNGSQPKDPNATSVGRSYTHLTSLERDSNSRDLSTNSFAWGDTALTDLKAILKFGYKIIFCRCTWTVINRDESPVVKLTVGLSWARWLASGAKIEKIGEFHEGENDKNRTRGERSHKESGALGRRDTKNEGRNRRNKRDAQEFLVGGILCLLTETPQYKDKSEEELRLACVLRFQSALSKSTPDPIPTSPRSISTQQSSPVTTPTQWRFTRPIYPSTSFGALTDLVTDSSFKFRDKIIFCRCTWIVINRDESKVVRLTVGLSWARWIVYGAKIEDEGESDRQSGARARRGTNNKGGNRRNNRDTQEFLLGNTMCAFVVTPQYERKSEEELRLTCVLRFRMVPSISTRDPVPTSTRWISNKESGPVTTPTRWSYTRPTYSSSKLTDTDSGDRTLTSFVWSLRDPSISSGGADTSITDLVTVSPFKSPHYKMIFCRCMWIVLNRNESRVKVHVGFSWARWLIYGAAEEIEDTSEFDEGENDKNRTRGERSDKEGGARGRRGTNNKGRNRRNKRDTQEFLLGNTMCAFVVTPQYERKSEEELRLACVLRFQFVHSISTRDSTPTSPRSNSNHQTGSVTTTRWRYTSPTYTSLKSSK